MKKIMIIIGVIFLGLILYMYNKLNPIGEKNTEDEVQMRPYLSIFKLQNIYNHDTSYFTQGLFFYDNKLYESTGLYGKSKIIRYLNLKEDITKEENNIDSNIFGEGSVIFNNKLYVLTWRENRVLIYNIDNLQLNKVLKYPRDGWGLTTDGKYLISSDGSSNIYFMDENLNDIKKIKVSLNDKDVININELEYINGYIWANIWKENYIIVINPQNGEVTQLIDFTDLIPKGLNEESVLNGIAYNNGKYYITGKNWPIIYELVNKDSLP